MDCGRTNLALLGTVLPVRELSRDSLCASNNNFSKSIAQADGRGSSVTLFSPLDDTPDRGVFAKCSSTQESNQRKKKIQMPLDSIFSC